MFNECSILNAQFSVGEAGGLQTNKPFNEGFITWDFQRVVYSLFLPLQAGAAYLQRG
jgi:hypothetical protein